MKKYIDQEAAEKIIAEVINRNGTEAEILTEIHYLPVADVVDASSVVEIVHCKECKFGEWNAVECAYWCQGRFRVPDWYCADAESKYEDVIK